MNQILRASKGLVGSITVPGDKSISHRALLLSALSQGTSRIKGLGPGHDVRATERCIQSLGANLYHKGPDTLVTSHGLSSFRPQREPLSCENSGTTMRLLMGILAAHPSSTELIGDASLCRRPMQRVSTPLTHMGAKVDLSPQGTAPLRVHGTSSLQSISYTLPIPSAQVKSAILLAGLFADGNTRVISPLPSRDHTERMLPQFGIQMTFDQQVVEVSGKQTISPADVDIPGDFSSAAFWIAAAILVEQSSIVIDHVSTNPTRTGLLTVLSSMGAHIDKEDLVLDPEPVGTLRVRTSSLTGVEVSPELIPSIIDELPLLAVLATKAHGTTVVRGAEELRRKESDRIATVAKHLRAMGAQIETFPDGFAVLGPTPLCGTTIDPQHDHRIAMAFSIAGLIASSETVITDAECVSVSYPSFFHDLKQWSG